LSSPRCVWRAPALVVALAAAALGAGAVSAADPPKKPTEPLPDAEFLEFLGRVDSTADAGTQPDDGSWMEYLAQADIDKAAQKAKPPNPSGTQTGASKVKSDD
jgi:hypothetical protein